MEDVIKRVQNCCLEIAVDIDRVCRKYGITYSLCGGSVIGAMLYQGFIPWDDDIDLMMTRDNYDRFINLYPKYADARFKLLHYSTGNVSVLPNLFARVEDISTETREELSGKVREGHVFVDITVIDDVPDRIYHFWIRAYTHYVYVYLYRSTGMIPGTAWKRALFSFVSGRVSEEKLREKYTNLEKTLRTVSRKRRASKCTELLSTRWSGLLYDRQIFDKYMDIPFCGYELMIVERYYDYLKARYQKTEFTKDVPENEKQPVHILEMHAGTEADEKGDN